MRLGGFREVGGGWEEGGEALCVASAPERCIALAGSRPAHLAIHSHPTGDEGGEGRRKRWFFIEMRGEVLLLRTFERRRSGFSTHCRGSSGAR